MLIGIAKRAVLMIVVKLVLAGGEAVTFLPVVSSFLITHLRPIFADS